jgi:DMSO/TMAO reductase YedYZ molybdopterin-dependent catalytic subunit
VNTVIREERRLVTAEPENSETPLEQVCSWVTPNRLFFVRNHFDVPPIDLSTWKLRVEGCVERATEWTWDEFAALPERSVFATVECAGNGRSFLRPAVPGVPWGAGAIGHGEWTGVPVRELLEQAGIGPGAIEVLFEGADEGTEPDHPQPMHFARSLPLEKALECDTLLAFRMNGELLEPAHGFPVRLFVPGWYGVASVKWLRRIEVLDRPFGGYFQSVKYTVQRPGPAGDLATVPVGSIAVKSEILRPQAGSVLGLGTNRLFGVAWAGEHGVDRVDVSVDCGSSWKRAQLMGPRVPYSWTMWEYLWVVDEPGSYSLLARATSDDGRVQPLSHDPRNGGYMIHHSRPVTVRVERARRIHDQPSDADLILYDMNAYAEENMRFPLDIELEFAQGEGI